MEIKNTILQCLDDSSDKFFQLNNRIFIKENYFFYEIIYRYNFYDFSLNIYKDGSMDIFIEYSFNYGLLEYLIKINDMNTSNIGEILHKYEPKYKKILIYLDNNLYKSLKGHLFCKDFFKVLDCAFIKWYLKKNLWEKEYLSKDRIKIKKILNLNQEKTPEEIDFSLIYNYENRCNNNEDNYKNSRNDAASSSYEEYIPDNSLLIMKILLSVISHLIYKNILTNIFSLINNFQFKYNTSYAMKISKYILLEYIYKNKRFTRDIINIYFNLNKDFDYSYKINCNNSSRSYLDLYSLDKKAHKINKNARYNLEEFFIFYSNFDLLERQYNFLEDKKFNDTRWVLIQLLEEYSLELSQLIANKHSFYLLMSLFNKIKGFDVHRNIHKNNIFFDSKTLQVK
jgi:hypothetical protein